MKKFLIILVVLLTAYINSSNTEKSTQTKK